MKLPFRQRTAAVPPQKAPHVSSRRFARSIALLAVTGLCAAAVANLSGSDSYEDRLVDIAARESLPQDVYAAADAYGSTEVKALLLDAAADRELVVKMQWALTRYGPDARKVLEAYGSDPMLHDILHRYGENVVPLIVFFMNHDIATLRARYGLRRFWERWRPAAEEKDIYGPEVRGLHAIERINADGHHFLGQFAISDDVAHWNQTDRILKSVENFLAGGMRDLETKHDVGAPIKIEDVAWAGADVLAVVGIAKALKFVKGAMGATGAIAKEASIASRTVLFGKRVLQNSRVGQSMLKFGAKIGTTYLIATHSGLLTSLFVEAGSWFGWPAWLSAGLGWWITLVVLSMFLLPVLGALVILVPVLRGFARGAMWLWPFASLRKKARAEPTGPSYVRSG